MSAGITVRWNRTSGLLAVLLALAMVASLVTAVPLASAASETEPNDSRENAQSIPIGEEVTGTITSDDTDWFAFEADRGETINVTGSVAAGDPSTRMLLYTRGDGLSADAIAPGETPESMGMTARYSGTYYVKVNYGRETRPPSDYTFTVETYETDAFEPNEDRANATRLYENPFPGDRAQVSIEDDDWFKFRAAQGETITVTGAAVTDRVRFRLTNADGNSINATAPRQTAESIGTTASYTGFHYVQASVGEGDPRPAYNFTVDVPGETLGLPNDRFEIQAGAPRGNQNRQNATPIESGTYANLGMVDDDEDWFRFRAAQDARVTVNTSYDSSANTLSVALVNAGGTTVASGNDSLATNVSTAGTYYLRVTGQANAQATYALALNVSAAGPGALPGQAQAPTDTDGDGRYEDVNGDGGLNVIDVSILLGVFDGVPSGEVPFYDYNDDGQLNILDVAALLNET